MAELQNFRIAFNGFHRDDVVRYIEELNNKHAEEVNQLNSDLKYYQEKLIEMENAAAEYAAAPAAPVAPVVVPVADIDADDTSVEELMQQLSLAQDAARTAEEELEAQKAENKRLQGLLDAALARQSAARARQEEELDTYRRAERVEREARNRANFIYDQVSTALSQATARMEDTASQINMLTETSMQQLKQLQLAISGSKEIFRDTVANLSAIRPEDE